MKTFTTSVLLLVFLSGTFYGRAQRTEGNVTINAGVGMSMFGIFGSLKFSLRDDLTVTSKSTPAYIASVDYAFDNNVSIGLHGGYQFMSQSVADYSYTDDNGVEQKGNFSYKMTRMTVGARILFHFGNDKIDAYAGVKPGVIIYDVSIDSNINGELPTWLRSSGARFAFQIIPIGMRGYLTENIGFFFEAGIGAPAFISGGLCFAVHKQGTPVPGSR